MLNELFDLLKTAKSKMGFVNVVATVEQINQLFEAEFKDDHTSINSSLDCVIKLLETYKKTAPATDAAKV